jgi:hypothetical protein
MFFISNTGAFAAYSNRVGPLFIEWLHRTDYYSKSVYSNYRLWRSNILEIQSANTFFATRNDHPNLIKSIEIYKLKFMLARLGVYLMAPNHFLKLRSNPKHYFSACRAFPSSPSHFIIQRYRHETKTTRRRWICPGRTWRYNMRKSFEIAGERRQNKKTYCIQPAS